MKFVYISNSRGLKTSSIYLNVLVMIHSESEL